MFSLIGFVSEHSTLFSTIFSGFGVVIIASIARHIYLKLKNKGNLLFSIDESKSYYFREIHYNELQEDKAAVLCVRTTIENNYDRDCSIVKYNLKISSPSQYKCRINERIPRNDTVRYRIGKNGSPKSSSWLGIQSEWEEDGRIFIPAGKKRETNLFFRTPYIMEKRADKLECKLKIRDSNDFRANCGFALAKTGYWADLPEIEQ